MKRNYSIINYKIVNWEEILKDATAENMSDIAKELALLEANKQITARVRHQAIKQLKDVARPQNRSGKFRSLKEKCISDIVRLSENGLSRHGVYETIRNKHPDASKLTYATFTAWFSQDERLEKFRIKKKKSRGRRAKTEAFLNKYSPKFDLSDGAGYNDF